MLLKHFVVYRVFGWPAPVQENQICRGNLPQIYQCRTCSYTSPTSMYLQVVKTNYTDFKMFDKAAPNTRFTIPTRVSLNRGVDHELSL